MELLSFITFFLVSKKVNLLDIPATISPGAIILGVGFSGVIGIIFGWSPAKKASELNPIDALKSI